MLNSIASVAVHCLFLYFTLYRKKCIYRKSELCVCDTFGTFYQLRGNKVWHRNLYDDHVPQALTTEENEWRYDVKAIKESINRKVSKNRIFKDT